MALEDSVSKGDWFRAENLKFGSVIEGQVKLDLERPNYSENDSIKASGEKLE